MKDSRNRRYENDPDNSSGFRHGLLYVRGAHQRHAIRTAFSVEKVSSSHSKGETVILSKEPLGENALRAAINATGYMAGEISAAVYEKKGFFHFGKKKHETHSDTATPAIGLTSVSLTDGRSWSAVLLTPTMRREICGK